MHIYCIGCNHVLDKKKHRDATEQHRNYYLKINKIIPIRAQHICEPCRIDFNKYSGIQGLANVVSVHTDSVQSQLTNYRKRKIKIDLEILSSKHKRTPDTLLTEVLTSTIGENIAPTLHQQLQSNTNNNIIAANATSLKCQSISKLEIQIDNMQLLDPNCSQLQEQLDKAKLHQQTAQHQRTIYKKHYDTLTISQRRVTMDFTVVDTQPHVGDNTSMKHLTDLVILIDYVQLNDQQQTIRKRKYIDIICSVLSTNDHFYFSTAISQLTLLTDILINDNVNKLIFWSDGGGKHFKSRYAMYLMLLVQKVHPHIVIEWNFFASYHGRSLCDAHAGYVKNKVSHRYVELEGMQKRNEEIVTSPPHDSEGFKQLIDKHDSENDVQMEVIILDEITKPEAIKPTLTPLTGIKSYHQFQFKQDKQTVLCRSLSDKGEWIEKKLFI